MDLAEYINQKKNLHSILLQYLENDDDDKDNDLYQQLFTMIINQQIFADPSEIKELIRTTMYLIANYKPISFKKSTNLIIDLINELKKHTISNYQIFQIFKNQKRLLLLLFQKKIITIDQYILKLMNKKKDMKYYQFFYPEVKSLIDVKEKENIEKELLSYDPKIFDNFDEKRLKGENDSYICELIRNDSIDKFSEYVSQTNYPISDKLNPSIFETNSSLIKLRPTPIEYASFFGSIQIFKFLIMRDASYDNEKIGICAIHGHNFDIIHALEKHGVNMRNSACLNEAIKCRYDDIFHYIVENNDEDFTNDIIKSSLHYHNFKYVPENDACFFYACSYDFGMMVDILLKEKEKQITEQIENHIKK